MAQLGQRRFVLLDRDGTLIHEREYLADPNGVELLPGAAAGLRRMAALGLGLAVVTNQSGIARGYFDLDCLARIHHRMSDLLAEQGVSLDGIFFCPHAPADHCTCRKPLTGLVEQAAAALNFRPSDSFVIGDKPCDVDLGLNVGAATILVDTGYGAQLAPSERAKARYNAANLEAAAEIIERLCLVSSGSDTKP